MKHAQNHAQHHQMMLRDFRFRLFISALLTVPIILLSPIPAYLFARSFIFAGSD